MQLFYTPDIATDPVLPESESAHAIRVLRLRTGDPIDSTDGRGAFYRSVIDEAHPRRTTLHIVDRRMAEPLWPFRLHIALAPTKSADRTEWFVEKAVEIGIDAITCLSCRNSERRTVNLAHLTKTAISAIKQSQKAVLPQIDGMTAFDAFVRQPFDGRKFIAHCHDDEAKRLLSHACQGVSDLRILIGPEGDFTPEEVRLALQQGYEPISLGPGRLRTETAALTACQTIHIVHQ